MLALASLWLLSPFAVGGLVGAWPRARAAACRRYPVMCALGVCGIVLVALGAFVLAEPAALIALAVGGPLSGLSFWVRRSDGDDGPGDDDADPGERPPSGDEWELIVEELERGVERHDAPTAPGRQDPPAPARPVAPVHV